MVFFILKTGTELFLEFDTNGSRTWEIFFRFSDPGSGSKTLCLILIPVWAAIYYDSVAAIVLSTKKKKYCTGQCSVASYSLIDLLQLAT
jgi:hypothetical protein